MPKKVNNYKNFRGREEWLQNKKKNRPKQKWIGRNIEEGGNWEKIKK